jgi:YD repeat-containing protein
MWAKSLPSGQLKNSRDNMKNSKNWTLNLLVTLGMGATVACSGGELQGDLRRPSAMTASGDEGETSFHDAPPATGTPAPAITTSSVETPVPTPPTSPAEPTSPPETTSPAEPTSPPETTAYWAAVRSVDSGYPLVEEWEYNQDAQLVRAQIVHLRRSVDPYYLVQRSLTFEDNKVRVFDDYPESEQFRDVTSEYVLDGGRVVQYSESRGGTVEVLETFEYDAQGKLVGGYYNNGGDEAIFRLERSSGGEPSRLFKNDQLLCTYSWRHSWLGTSCSFGQQTESYKANNGLLTVWQDDSSIQRFTYDSASRLTGITDDKYFTVPVDFTGDPTYSDTITHSYSPEGKLIESVYPLHRELREYDERGLLSASHIIDETGTYTDSYTYERLKRTEVLERRSSGGDTVETTYRLFDREPTTVPTRPSFFAEIGMSLPEPYYAPTDYSAVP